MPSQKRSDRPRLMKIKSMIQFLALAFLLPGTIFIKGLGVTPGQDGGIMRGMFNMMFWGVVVVFFAIIFTLKT